MKRILATALAVLLIATMAISGSVAYLTSTDNDTNTFTMGDVEIIQHEKDRNGNDFNNEQNLLPGHEFREGHTPATLTELTGTNCKLWKTESGAIDKIVTVENTGKTRAYVRTIFALEDTGMIATNNQIKLNWNESAGEANDDIAGHVLINGEYYRLYEYIYTTVLDPETTTAPSLLQVAMSAKVGNDVVDAIAASADGRYTILVATQAVQYDNMVEMVDGEMKPMTAEAALDAAFYDVTSEKNPWTMNEVEGSEAENAGTVIYLNSKSDLLALSGKKYDVNTTFVLENDIDMDNATMYRIGIDYSHSPVVKFVGNGHTISNMKIASMDNDTFGMSNAGLFELRGAEEGNTSLTVENLKLRNVAVTGENKSAGKECIGAAVVVGYMTDNCTVTLNNVDVYDSTINNTNSNASVFVGYTTGKVTLTDCDAYGCKIKGEDGEHTGTFVGTANTSNCTVSISNCINNATDLTATSEAQAKDIGRNYNNTATITGTGMEGVLVSSASELSTALSALNGAGDNTNRKIVLTKDITLTGGWTPVDIDFKAPGTSEYQPLAQNVNVTIDGAGHSISGLKVGENEHSGLIGKLNNFQGKFTIKNLCLKDVDISGNNNTDKNSESSGGALIAYVDCKSANNLLIENVHVEGGTIKDSKYIGGLIGNIAFYTTDSTVINNCSVTDVTLNSTYAEGTNVKGHVGGLVGGAYNGKISNCTTKNMTITGSTTEKRAGALIGSILTDNVNIGSGNKCINVKVNDVVANASNTLYKGSVDNRTNKNDSISYS